MFLSNPWGQDWKNGVGGIGRSLPKYQKEPVEQDPMAVDAEVPTLHLCEIKDDLLQVPMSVRQQYLQDPVRSCEWKSLLKEFDRKWTTETAEKESSNATQGESNGSGNQGFKWGDVFPDEPNTKADLDSKYGTPAASFAINETLSACVVEGPCLFLVASGDVEFGTTEPIVCYGAGVWLLDAKAETYRQDCVVKDEKN